MGTRATISKVNTDGTVTSIYTHWDGYLEHHGVILLANYQTAKQVDELLALGSLSQFGEKIGTKHDFEKVPEGECNAYHRDRNEEWAHTQPTVFQSLKEFKEVTDHHQEFDYVYHNGDWRLVDGSSLKLLRVAVKRRLREVEKENRSGS